MDIKDYISPGILESYIVGTISDEERQKVEHNLGQYPELRRELRRIETSRHTRELLNAVDTKTSGATIASLPISIPSKPVARIRNLIPENSVQFWRITAAAAIFLALLACYFVNSFRSQLSATQIALRAELDRNHELGTELSSLHNEIKRISGISSELPNDPTYTRITLAGSSALPDVRVIVFWDPRSLHVFITPENLPPLTRHQQYRLWALAGDEMLSAGAFNAGNETIRMNDVPRAEAFAVTVGPIGGSSGFDPFNQILIGETGM